MGLPDKINETELLICKAIGLLQWTISVIPKKHHKTNQYKEILRLMANRCFWDDRFFYAEAPLAGQESEVEAEDNNKGPGSL